MRIKFELCLRSVRTVPILPLDKRSLGRKRGDSSQSGQASIEWLALTLLVALLLAAVVASGLRPPGTGLVEAVAGRILCAVGAGACGETPALIAAYGPEVAAEVRRHAPALAFERGETSMPVDFRKCRRRACAKHQGRGRVSAATTGRQPVAFTRVLDCRDPGPQSECDDESRRGNLYIHYWFYYPDSATFRGVPVLAERGYHRHDWESLQIRVGRSGRVEARASSHHGHNHRQGVVNWASDAGIGPVNAVLEKTGIRPTGGWGEPSGWLFVSAGSHAGNVHGKPFRLASYSRPEDLHLIPIEDVADDHGQPDFSPITPPWRKRLWRQPEADTTS